MERINATMRKIGSSKIETLMYFTQSAMVGRRIMGGMIIREIKDPMTILVWFLAGAGRSFEGWRFRPNTIRISGIDTDPS